MGSLTSRPKVPASVSSYSATPIASSPAPAVTAPQTPTALVSTPSGDAFQGDARTENLLTRGRGIFGTVLTGFRGLLAQVEGKQKKSLLGE